MKLYVIIREYNNDTDRQQVIEIYKLAFSGMPYRETFSEEQVSGFIDKCLNLEKHCFVVAEVKNLIVGFTWSIRLSDKGEATKIFEDTFPVGETAFIEELSVRKEFRGRGFATILITTLLGLLKNIGYRYVLASTHIANKGSLKVFERCGFESTYVCHKSDVGGGRRYIVVYLMKEVSISKVEKIKNREEGR